MTLPAQVLDLTRWKLTLPIGQAEKPTEIKWPTLGTYQHSDYFMVNPAGGVRFRAPVNGVTTSGSGNPRSELREMNTDGSNASWSSSSGAHELTVVEAVTHLPNPRTDGGNAGVVGAQIHDASDDITVFRLEGAKLYVTRGDDTHCTLADGAYVLGTPFEARFQVWQDKVKAYYNGRLIVTIPGKFSGAYFKAGCYTQANKSNSKPADASNYGEVRVLSVSVLHTATLPVPIPVPPSTPQPVPVPTQLDRIEAALKRIEDKL